MYINPISRKERHRHRDGTATGTAIGAALNVQTTSGSSSASSPASLSSSSTVLSAQQHSYDIMLPNGSSEGVFSSNTPPLSRQRRHSKLHLRIASEISVDQSCSNTVTTNSNSNKNRYRIVLLGASAVGKTAIVEQFLYGSFPSGHSATVEELHKGEYELCEGGCIPLEILDTSGSYEFPAMRRLAIATGDAFALIYSIDNSETFEEVKRLREVILQVKGGGGLSPNGSTDQHEQQQRQPPIVVVGNKSDLSETSRAVQIEMAECECIDWDHGFVECSAKNNENIVNIFSSMLIQARLKGILNVTPTNAEKSASNSPKHTRHKELLCNSIEPLRHQHQFHHQQHHDHRRRRSSLPISELFHRSSQQSISNSLSLQPNKMLSSTSPNASAFRKRNSCTPS